MSEINVELVDEKDEVNIELIDKEVDVNIELKDVSEPFPLETLTNVEIDNLKGNDIIVFNEDTGKWENSKQASSPTWENIQGDQSSVSVSGFTNDVGYLTSYTETDPVFTGWDKSTGISITESQISDFGTYQKTSEKGQANGYAGLDQGGKVSLQHLPSTLLKYMGVWNPVTNTPELISPDITKVGQVYNVGAEGSRFGYDWKLGDWAIYNESGIIELSKNSDDVVQVNGQTGSVELDLTDMNDVDDSLKAEGKFLVVDNQGEHVYTEIDESKWEVDGTGYIKPKGVDKVKAENIEGIPTNSDFNLSDLSDVDATSKSTNKILQVDVSGKHIYTDIPDTSKWEADGTGYIKPVDGGKVKVEHVDSVPKDLVDLSDVDTTNKATDKILQVNSDGNHEYIDMPDLSDYATLDWVTEQIQEAILDSWEGEY